MQRATPPARQVCSREAGFSLVELMVVIFLVSLATTFIVLTAPPGKSPARKAAETLTGSLQQMSDRAIVSGQTLAMRIDADGFTALARERGNWVVLPGTRQRLPGDVEIAIQHERRDTTPPTGAPDLMFDPLGGARAAHIVIRDRREAFEVHIAPTGAIGMQEMP